MPKANRHFHHSALCGDVHDGGYDGGYDDDGDYKSRHKMARIPRMVCIQDTQAWQIQHLARDNHTKSCHERNSIGDVCYGCNGIQLSAVGKYALFIGDAPWRERQNTSNNLKVSILSLFSSLDRVLRGYSMYVGG